MIRMGRSLAAVWFCSALAAQTLPDGATALAKKILLDLKPPEHATYSLTLSEGAAQAGDQVRSKLEAAGLKRAAEGSEADIRIILNENLRGYVWVAEAGRGPDRQVTLLEWPRPAQTEQSQPALPLELKKEKLWTQDDPMLDWTPVQNGSALLVLEADRLALYRRDGSGWTPVASEPVPAAKSRDPRGHIALVAGTGGFTVFLPAGVCTGLVEDSLKLDCQPTAAAWPLEAGGRQLGDAAFSSDRNFFDGKVTTGRLEGALPPFYSFAAVSGEKRGGDGLWIFAGVDGQTRLYTPRMEPAGAISNFGSGIAPVATACGDEVLATAPGDETERDSARAYRMDGGRAIADSLAVEFSGPVTALWPAADGKSAHAVVRELKTGRYAALRLDAICTR